MSRQSPPSIVVLFLECSKEVDHVIRSHAKVAGLMSAVDWPVIHRVERRQLTTWWLDLLEDDATINAYMAPPWHAAVRQFVLGNHLYAEESLVKEWLAHLFPNAQFVSEDQFFGGKKLAHLFPSSEYDAVEIGELALDPVSYARLKNMGIRTVGQLREWREDELRALLGARSAYGETLGALSMLGLEGPVDDASMLPNPRPDSALTGELQDDIPIEELEFGQRTYNSLKRVGIDTLGALTLKSAVDLMAVPNFSQKSLEEVVETLKLHRLTLRGYLLDGMSIEEFSDRFRSERVNIYNLLKRARINTVGELVSHSEQELKDAVKATGRGRTLEPTRIAVINQALEEAGLPALRKD